MIHASFLVALHKPWPETEKTVSFVKGLRLTTRVNTSYPLRRLKMGSMMPTHGPHLRRVVALGTTPMLGLKQWKESTAGSPAF